MFHIRQFSKMGSVLYATYKLNCFLLPVMYVTFASSLGEVTPCVTQFSLIVPQSVMHEIACEDSCGFLKSSKLHIAL
jgi:hypothetical protein